MVPGRVGRPHVAEPGRPKRYRSPPDNAAASRETRRSAKASDWSARWDRRVPPLASGPRKSNPSPGSPNARISNSPCNGGCLVQLPRGQWPAMGRVRSEVSARCRPNSGKRPLASWSPASPGRFLQRFPPKTQERRSVAPLPEGVDDDLIWFTGAAPIEPPDGLLAHRGAEIAQFLPDYDNLCGSSPPVSKVTQAGGRSSSGRGGIGSPFAITFRCERR